MYLNARLTLFVSRYAARNWTGEPNKMAKAREAKGYGTGKIPTTRSIKVGFSGPVELRLIVDSKLCSSFKWLVTYVFLVGASNLDAREDVLGVVEPAPSERGTIDQRVKRASIKGPDNRNITNPTDLLPAQ